ncbi:eukaryotic translation initiation factor 3 subunit E [Tulasnella sp. 427]|nr:eukaryotic translation initiation factor 3 subunit E [Tulasnella sp. 427]
MAAQYDLTTKIIPYLDRHLVFPLLSFLSEHEIFPAEELIKAQYELATHTHMVDYIASLYQQIHPGEEFSADFLKKREDAVATNARLSEETDPVMSVIQNPEVAQNLRQDKLQNFNYLKETFGVTSEQIIALYNMGQFQFSIGGYSAAADYLYHFRILYTPNDLLLSAQWGKLASEILSGNWDKALDELNKLKEVIESGLPIAASSAPTATNTPGSAALTQLQARSWLMHWSLFVYFNADDGRAALLETFLNSTYLNTMQTSCPWLLRYLAAASIISRKGNAGASRTVRTSLPTIVKLIQAEQYQYSDPITTFLTDVYVDFDFEQAQKSLKEAETVLDSDFFLWEFKGEFLENARYVVSEAYCRIHQRIDIADLSARLNLSPSEGEKWIVNLIRDSDSRSTLAGDAKIDLEQNVISTSKPSVPVYQSIIEKTKGLAFRTQVLGAALAKRGQGDVAAEEGAEKENVATTTGKGRRGGGKAAAAAATQS